MKLDSVQEKIVNSSSNKIIVNAGAGSGKTRVLIERIRKLLESGVEPSSIVAITFTNMATDEMKERLQDVERSNEMFVGTIHKLANVILGQSDEEYAILTSELEDQYMRTLLKKYGTVLDFKKYKLYKKIKERESMGLKNKMRSIDILTPEEYIEFWSLYRDSPTKKYPETLATMIERDNAITFDQLIVKATDYFSKTGNHIEYLFVDEFQDIGRLEYEFFNSLNADNYFYIGDDWQSIYSFKGSCVDIFIGLFNDPEWESFTMANNYRCGSEILDAANVVIKQDLGAINKQTMSMSGIKGNVEFGNKRELVDIVTEYVSNGQAKETAILVRTNRELETVMDIFDYEDIPYITFKKGDLTKEELNKLLKEDRVKILTVHASKGLEFNNVVMYGNFPLYEPSFRSNPEERRVMYVGMTRAINNLHVLN